MQVRTVVFVTLATLAALSCTSLACTEFTEAMFKECEPNSNEWSKLVADNKTCKALTYNKDGVDFKACLVEQCSEEAYEKELTYAMGVACAKSTEVKKLVNDKKICEALTYMKDGVDIKACVVEQCSEEAYEKVLKEYECSLACTEITDAMGIVCEAQSTEVVKLVTDNKTCEALTYMKDGFDMKACLVEQCSEESYEKELKKNECSLACTEITESMEVACAAKSTEVVKLVTDKKICEALTFNKDGVDMKACLVGRCSEEVYEKELKKNECSSSSSSSVLAFSSSAVLVSLLVNIF